jgi:hypothetical protein
MTGHELPSEIVETFFKLAQNDGPTDGVAQTATALSISVLVTLTDAGRNATDITIPTQAGTEGADEEEEKVRYSAVAIRSSFRKNGFPTECSAPSLRCLDCNRSRSHERATGQNSR